MKLRVFNRLGFRKNEGRILEGPTHSHASVEGLVRNKLQLQVWVRLATIILSGHGLLYHPLDGQDLEDPSNHLALFGPEPNPSFR